MLKDMIDSTLKDGFHRSVLSASKPVYEFDRPDENIRIRVLHNGKVIMTVFKSGTMTFNILTKGEQQVANEVLKELGVKERVVFDGFGYGSITRRVDMKHVTYDKEWQEV